MSCVAPEPRRRAVSERKCFVMETWAYCRACTRWFHCPQWFDPRAPQPVCSTCFAEPTAIERRARSLDHDELSSALPTS